MISDFLNDYQNNSIINKTKKRFYLFSNIALIVGIIFFLFIFYKNLSFEDIARFGNGGMCLNCEICSFPHCSFGK